MSVELLEPSIKRRGLATDPELYVYELTINTLAFVDDEFIFPRMPVEFAAVKTTALLELEYVGGVEVTILAWFKAVLLSLHCVTLVPESESVLESAPSNHNTHPSIVIGVNPYVVVVIGILFQQQNKLITKTQ